MQGVRQPPIASSPVERLKSILDERPLYLSIETTNICNARCVFCAYPKMRRKKRTMSADLFEKIVRDYDDMGGGAIGLTPIVGDVLLDGQLVDRLRLLRRSPSITHVCFTTNGIAWDRWSDEDREFLLENVSAINVSLGGLDAASYRAMFAVDRFARVRTAILDICERKKSGGLSVEIHLLFRVSQPIDELLADPRTDEFRREEINSISGLNRFANWGGLIRPEELPDGARLIQVETSPDRVRSHKKNPCFVYYLTPEITCDGMVSACGCMNAEAEELILGDVNTDHLADIWRGDARRRLMNAFGTDALSPICRQCSYYEDGEKFIRQAQLARFEIGDQPWNLLRPNSSTATERRVIDEVRRLTAHGFRRIALYGAGQSARSALAVPENSRGSNSRADGSSFDPIVALIDDDPALTGQTVRGIPVLSIRQALANRIDAIVLSSDWHATQMWENARPLREAGIPVLRIDSPQ